VSGTLAVTVPLAPVDTELAVDEPPISVIPTLDPGLLGFMDIGAALDFDNVLELDEIPALGPPPLCPVIGIVPLSTPSSNLTQR
jgi:hypothetical protein